MKLSKLYTNYPKIFTPIIFHEGMNAVLGEIRLPENKTKDTHNLGKSTLGRLLDFTLLSKKDKNLFLFQQDDLFNQFVFFLEIKLEESGYLTIRRSISQPTKISFHRHNESNQDFSCLSFESWNHWNLDFSKAKKLLDGILNISVVKPWNYRKCLGYLIRTQEDYQQVFQLKKMRGKDSQWKPHMAKLLGFDAKLVELLYQKKEELDDKKKEEASVRRMLGLPTHEISQIEGILLLKTQEAKKNQSFLDAFDFRQADQEKTMLLVEELDIQISDLNKSRYYLSHQVKKITQSLEEDKVFFQPNKVEELFNEAGILFKGQIKRDFEQLVEFNRAITEERFGYLMEEKEEIEEKLKKINQELDTLGKQRSEVMEFLGGSEVFDKYKAMTNDLVSLRADIELLEQQKSGLKTLQALTNEVRVLEEECLHIQAKVEEEVSEQTENQDSLFSKIRLYFSEIIQTVINRQALLTVYVNKIGNLDFSTEILDDYGRVSSADKGNTYRKLLCIAFDLSILRAHLTDRFPHFVFHDGVFESLDDRKKEKLLIVLRDYANLGVQSIITLIDSDIPKTMANSQWLLEDNAIVLRLHDEGESGRLFKMRRW